MSPSLFQYLVGANRQWEKPISLLITISMQSKPENNTPFLQFRNTSVSSLFDSHAHGFRSNRILTSSHFLLLVHRCFPSGSVLCYLPHFLLAKGMKCKFCWLECVYVSRSNDLIVPNSGCWLNETELWTNTQHRDYCHIFFFFLFTKTHAQTSE